MTYDEYEKSCKEWAAKKKAVGREILEVIIKYSLTAAEAKDVLKDVKTVATGGAAVTADTLGFWDDREITG